MKIGMECKHEWVKVSNIDKIRFWFIFIYANEIRANEKYVCLKCGEEIK